VGYQGELRHGQGGGARVEQGTVEPARVVLEDPQPRDLVGEALRVGRGVAVRDAEEHAEPGPDRPARRGPGGRDALDDRLHRSLTVPGTVRTPERFRARCRVLTVPGMVKGRGREG